MYLVSLRIQQVACVIYVSHEQACTLAALPSERYPTLGGGCGGGLGGGAGGGLRTAEQSWTANQHTKRQLSGASPHLHVAAVQTQVAAEAAGLSVLDAHQHPSGGRAVHAYAQAGAAQYMF